MKTPKQKKNKVYFGKDVQNSIILYNSLNTTDLTNQLRSEFDINTINQIKNRIKSVEYEKSKLFEQDIYPALNKLCENIINKWKFWNYETNYQDLKTDAVTHLYDQLGKYNPETGSKAYSYFTIIGRNFLIRKYKSLVQGKGYVSDLEVVDESRNIPLEVSKDEFKNELTDFLYIWCDYIEENISRIVCSENDKIIITAILQIFRSCHDFDIDNRKMLYILIKEQHRTTTTHITRNINKLKDLFYKMFRVFIKTGKIKLIN